MNACPSLELSDVLQATPSREAIDQRAAKTKLRQCRRATLRAMNSGFSLLAAIAWFGVVATLIAVGWRGRNWIALAVGGLLLAVSVWNLIAMRRS